MLVLLTLLFIRTYRRSLFIYYCGIIRKTPDNPTDLLVVAPARLSTHCSSNARNDALFDGPGYGFGQVLTCGVWK